MTAENLNLLSLSVKIAPENKMAFADWQTELHHVIAEAPGFVSLEILSPEQIGGLWKVVQHFCDEAALTQWKESAQGKQLMASLQKLAVNHAVEESLLAESSVRNGITEVFITNVSKGKEEIYKEWIAKVHQIEVQFPGFKGVYVQSPSQSSGQNWLTFLQFDSRQNLDLWLASPERKNLLMESEPLISSLESHRVISPYSNWFSGIDKGGEQPSVWKQTMVVLLVLFPIVMLQFKFLVLLTKGWDISLATFLGNAISVALISWPLMPIAIKCLRWWLLPKGPNSQAITLLGTLFMFFLYALEVAYFWSFVKPVS